MAVSMLLCKYIILGLPNEGLQDLWASMCLVLSRSFMPMELMMRHLDLLLKLVPSLMQVLVNSTTWPLDNYSPARRKLFSITTSNSQFSGCLILTFFVVCRTIPATAIQVFLSLRCLPGSSLQSQSLMLFQLSCFVQGGKHHQLQVLSTLVLRDFKSSSLARRKLLSQFIQRTSFMCYFFFSLVLRL